MTNRLVAVYLKKVKKHKNKLKKTFFINRSACLILFELRIPSTTTNIPVRSGKFDKTAI